MKAYIGPYKNTTPGWKFFRDTCKWESETIHKMYGWIAKIYDWRERKIKIKTHRYDHWSVDYTISLIALPILKDLRTNLHGCPATCLEEGEEYEYSMERWKLILNKIIWAHEQIINEEIDAFYIVRGEWIIGEPNPKTKCSPVTSTNVINWDAMHAYEERIQEGLELFGRYYRNLWD